MVKAIFEREMEKFCEEYELMSSHEKNPKPIEDEVKSKIIRVIKKR